MVWLGTSITGDHAGTERSSGTWGRGDELFPRIFRSETYVGV